MPKFLLQNNKTGEYLTQGFIQWTEDEDSAEEYEQDEVATISFWLSAQHGVQVSSVPI